MLRVTGGAGFVGSNIVAALDNAGRADVVVCDCLGSDGKWRNLAKRQLVDAVPPADLSARLDGRKLDAIIHMGAISETTAAGGDLVIETDFRLSEASVDRLQRAGYNGGFTSFEDGAGAFVKEFLNRPDSYR
jgi:ADP-L-glycero-D-manno-heptose 6-epimerase